ATPVVDTVLAVDQLWNLGNGRYRAVFLPPEQPSTTGTYYVRFRYECGDVTGLLQDKGWGFAKRGWVFDLRINDVRETVGLPAQIDATRMLNVSEAYIFVIAPNAFVPALSSPP